MTHSATVTPRTRRFLVAQDDDRSLAFVGSVRSTGLGLSDTKYKPDRYTGDPHVMKDINNYINGNASNISNQSMTANQDTASNHSNKANYSNKATSNRAADYKTQSASASTSHTPTGTPRIDNTIYRNTSRSVNNIATSITSTVTPSITPTITPSATPRSNVTPCSYVDQSTSQLYHSGDKSDSDLTDSDTDANENNQSDTERDQDNQDNTPMFKTTMKMFNTVVFYNNKAFNYNSSVYIVDIDDCLLKSYKKTNKIRTRYKPYNKAFVRALRNALVDSSMVVIGKTANTKISIEVLRNKLSCVERMVKVPFIGVFYTMPNGFSKPHTASWSLIKSMYALKQMAPPTATVISDFGGIMYKKERITHDLDRAFANNIGARFLSIEEFTEKSVVEFKWDDSILEPDKRMRYIEAFAKEKNISITRLLLDATEDAFLIIVIGPPRSGKSTYIKAVLDEWKTTKKSEEFVFECIDGKKDSKQTVKKVTKLLGLRINVILEGGCINAITRDPYVRLVDQMNVRIFIVEVCTGMHMSKLFNHIAVEENNDLLLVNEKEYINYKSKLERPSYRKPAIQYIPYYPRIRTNRYVQSFRF